MRKWPWLDNLRELGFAPEDIDIVMCTHLHPDHVGWNTLLVDGQWVPTFPNARYVFARKEYEQWQADSAGGASPRIGETFHDSVLTVVDAGLAEIVEDDHEIGTGIRLEPTPGIRPATSFGTCGRTTPRASSSAI